MFAKIIRKFSIFFREVLSSSIEQTLPEVKDENVAEMDGEETKGMDAATAMDKMDEDLEEAGTRAVSAMQEKQKELINSLNLDKYAIDDNTEEWAESKKDLEKAAKTHGTAAVKSNKKRKIEKAEDIYQAEISALKKSSKKKHGR